MVHVQESLQQQVAQVSDLLEQQQQLPPSLLLQASRLQVSRAGPQCCRAALTTDLLTF